MIPISNDPEKVRTLHLETPSSQIEPLMEVAYASLSYHFFYLFFVFLF